MNRIILSGRVVREVELKQANNGTQYLTNVLAVKNGTETMFVDFTAFKTTAVFINNYVRKGDKLVIEGTLDLKTVTFNEKKRLDCKVMVQAVELCGKAEAAEPKPAIEPSPSFSYGNKETVEEDSGQDDDLDLLF